MDSLLISQYLGYQLDWQNNYIHALEEQSGNAKKQYILVIHFNSQDFLQNLNNFELFNNKCNILALCCSLHSHRSYPNHINQSSSIEI